MQWGLRKTSLKLRLKANSNSKGRKLAKPFKAKDKVKPNLSLSIKPRTSITSIKSFLQPVNNSHGKNSSEGEAIATQETQKTGFSTGTESSVKEKPPEPEDANV